MAVTSTRPVVALDAHRRLAAFVSGLEGRTTAVAEEAAARQRSAAPELALPAETDLATAGAQAIATVVELALIAMRSPAAAPRELPEPLARLAGDLARREIHQRALLNLLRTTHAVLLDQVLAHAQGTATPLEVVEVASSHLFWYVDLLIPLVAEAHERERRRLGAHPGSVRVGRIRAVLDGADRLDLDYPLDGPHVAVILRGTKARGLLRATLERLGVSSLVTDAPDGSLWAWLACPHCEDEVMAALKTDWPGGCFAGISGSEKGVTGFRATHRKAWMALQLGRRRGSAVTTFGDISLEALAFGGEQMAREFVRAEMEPLLNDGPRVAAVRETLSAYFALGSAAAAARRLGISERAVIYRLRHAERMLDRPLTTRRAELETALRLHEMFAAAHLRAA